MLLRCWALQGQSTVWHQHCIACHQKLWVALFQLNALLFKMTAGRCCLAMTSKIVHVMRGRVSPEFSRLLINWKLSKSWSSTLDPVQVSWVMAKLVLFLKATIYIYIYISINKRKLKVKFGSFKAIYRLFDSVYKCFMSYYENKTWQNIFFKKSNQLIFILL